MNENNYTTTDYRNIEEAEAVLNLNEVLFYSIPPL